MYRYFSCLAVAPTTEMEPIMATVYRPARAMSAPGAKARRGAMKAAWVALKAVQRAYLGM